MIKCQNALLPWLTLAAVVAACESNTSDGTSPNSAGSGGSAAQSGGANSAGAMSAGTSSGGATAGGGAAAAGSGGSGAAGGAQAGASGGVGAGGMSAHGGAGDAGASQGGEADEFDGEAGGPGEGGQEFAYVSLSFGGVLTCSVDLQSGETKLLPGSPINPSGSAANIAVDKSQHFVYVADQQRHIDTYRIAADGTLPAHANSSVTTAADLIALTLDPKGRFAYAGSSAGQELYAFKIDAASGALTAIAEPLKVGGGPAFLAADPTGNLVYLSMQAEIGLRGYRIDQTTGALGELAESPFATTSLPAGDVLFGGGIVFNPSGDVMYTSGGGLNAFSINRTSGELTLLAGSPFTLDVNSDPNAPDIAIDPQGSYLYVTRFLVTNDLSGFKILPSGALEPVPNMPFRGDSPYSIAVDRAGRFAFVGVDGPTLAVYRIARSSGFLTPVAGSEFQFGGPEPKIVFASP